MDKLKLRIFYIVYTFALVVFIIGVLFRVTVLADQVTSEDKTTEIFTSEEAEAVTKLLNEGGLSSEDHEKILEAGRRYLEQNQDFIASSTDSDFDTNTYLTYGIDQEWFDSTTPLHQMYNDIYRMILSIRNILLILICGLIIVFVHGSMKKIISRITKGGIK